jgi:hypothetical protein
MNVRERESVFIGVGAGLMLIVLLVLQSSIGSGLLSTRTVTTTATVTTELPAGDYNLVASAYTNHLSVLGSKNVSALLGGYENNSTVEWTGEAAGQQGNYTGEGIGRLLTTFLRYMTNFTLSNETQPLLGVQGRYWVVNSTFHWAGYSTVDGILTGTVAAEDSYVHVGNTWLIARETWTWLLFTCQYPDCFGI